MYYIKARMDNQEIAFRPWMIFCPFINIIVSTDNVYWRMASKIELEGIK